jgi:hypothetical protein
MLVVQVDVVDAESLQGAFDRVPYVAGLLSTTPGPPREWDTKPNFVANTTWRAGP